MVGNCLFQFSCSVFCSGILVCFLVPSLESIFVLWWIQVCPFEESENHRQPFSPFGVCGNKNLPAAHLPAHFLHFSCPDAAFCASTTESNKVLLFNIIAASPSHAASFSVDSAWAHLTQIIPAQWVTCLFLILFILLLNHVHLLVESSLWILSLQNRDPDNKMTHEAGNMQSSILTGFRNDAVLVMDNLLHPLHLIWSHSAKDSFHPNAPQNATGNHSHWWPPPHDTTVLFNFGAFEIPVDVFLLLVIESLYFLSSIFIFHLNFCDKTISLQD